MNTTKNSISVNDMVYTALFAAVLCAVAPFSIRIGPIPLSFATLVIYIAAGSLGWKYSVISVFLYVALGAVGLPVFSGFEGGFHKIAVVTGGFIIGYFPLALATGFAADASKCKRLFFIAGMVVGTFMLYTLGTAWFVLQTGSTLAAALMACVVPFLIGDTIKIVIATIAAPQLRLALAQLQSTRKR